MTCHHTKEVPPFGQSAYTTKQRLLLANIPHPSRCRCIVITIPDNHCHQLVTQEDFLCDYCRDICFAEAPERFTIDISNAITPLNCLIFVTCPLGTEK